MPAVLRYGARARARSTPPPPRRRRLTRARSDAARRSHPRPPTRARTRSTWLRTRARRTRGPRLSLSRAACSRARSCSLGTRRCRPCCATCLCWSRRRSSSTSTSASTHCRANRSLAACALTVACACACAGKRLPRCAPSRSLRMSRRSTSCCSRRYRRVASRRHAVWHRRLLCERQLEHIRSLGAQLVLSSRSVGDAATQYFAMHGVAAFGHVPRVTLERVAATCGTRVHVRARRTASMCAVLLTSARACAGEQPFVRRVSARTELGTTAEFSRRSPTRTSECVRVLVVACGPWLTCFACVRGDQASARQAGVGRHCGRWHAACLGPEPLRG